jgi:hypothetical protein
MTNNFTRIFQQFAIETSFIPRFPDCPVNGSNAHRKKNHHLEATSYTTSDFVMYLKECQ